MRIRCEQCKNYARALYRENRWVKWIDIECSCGYNKIMKEDELDLLQPDNPLWDLVYDNNLFEETEKRKKEIKQEKEKRKEFLNYEYNKKFKKPWERKFVKERVLEDK